MAAPWLGLWRFDPEASDYGAAPKPERALYTLIPSGDQVHTHIWWTDPEGTHQSAFVMHPGAGPRSLPDGSTLLTEVRGERLCTRVERDGELIHSAQRQVEGEVLQVLQRVGDVETRSVYRRDQPKQVLLYRRDLKMRKGKIAAQCAHAALKVFTQLDRGSLMELRAPLPGPIALWLRGRSAKIVLSVEDEESLLAAYDHASARGIPVARITDAGRTEFKGVPTRTTVALGPWAASIIDEVSGPEGLVATKLA